MAKAKKKGKGKIVIPNAVPKKGRSKMMYWVDGAGNVRGKRMKYGKKR